MGALRDLLVFALIMSVMPTAFRRPFIGLALFSWLAYMRPQDLCWGFARDMRFSFFAAIVMIAGWFVHESGSRRFWRPDLRTGGMVVLAAIAGLSVTLARYSFESQFVTTFYLEFVKIMVIAAFTTGQVDTRQRLKFLAWVIAISFGFYGFKNGLLGVARGGTVILRGPGGMLEDNNDFALAMVMGIPLLWYLGRAESLRWVRRGTEVAIALTIVTVLLTLSRGAFLALCATLLWLAWRARRLVPAIAVLGVLTIAFFLFAPQQVLDRIALIGEGTAEGSAGARIKAWGIAFAMIGDHPLIGVGLKNFRFHYPDYNPTHFEGSTEAFVAHNSYLQIWAEGGTISFAIYLVLLGSMFWSAAWVRRVARGRPHLEWADTYSRMLEAVTVAFMVGATFLNRGHFDLIYHVFALMSCLVWITRKEAVAWRDAEQPAASGARPGEIEVRWRPVAEKTLLPRWGR